MKKLCLLLALCLTVLCALPMGAGAEAADPALSAMVQRALKLADIMQECAQSEAYCSLYAGSAEIGALCAAMGEGPYDAPVSGALLTLSPAAMDRLLQIGDSAPALSEGIRQKIYASVFHAGIPRGRHGAGRICHAVLRRLRRDGCGYAPGGGA